MFSRLIFRLVRIEENLIFALLIFMSLLTFIQVVTRYVFFMPLPWSEEVARYLMVWMVFVGAGLAVFRRAHITLDILPLIIKGSLAKDIASIIVNLLSLLFAVIFMALAFRYVKVTVDLHQVTPALRLPMYVANGSTLVGAVLLAVHYLHECIGNMQAMQKNRRDKITSSENK